MAKIDLPTHGDFGLQPERTALAWSRTTLSMVVAATIFLRWMPHHGAFAGTLVIAALVSAIAINITRRRRLERAIIGINPEAMAPDFVSTAALAGSVVILAVLGIFTVLFLPLE